MKINFTKKEFQALLDMMYITDWVLNAHEDPEKLGNAEYRKLSQKILTQAQDFGLEDMVETNDAGYAMPSKKFVDTTQAMQLIEKFENATFWEELLERMGRRDFIREYGEHAIREMSLTERFEKEMVFQQWYDREFGDHGLEHLEIVSPSDGSRQKH